MCPTLVTASNGLVNFYVYLHVNFGYSVLNSARDMLSSFATVEEYDASKHPLVCRYMKGVYNSNTSFLKRSFASDALAVVKYLSSIIRKSLLDISRKSASLLAILCDQR